MLAIAIDTATAAATEAAKRCQGNVCCTGNRLRPCAHACPKLRVRLGKVLEKEGRRQQTDKERKTSRCEDM